MDNSMQPKTQKYHKYIDVIPWVIYYRLSHSLEINLL